MIEYRSRYKCSNCGKESKPETLEGRFGHNVLVAATLMKFEDRLPLRKVKISMERMFMLCISAASVFNFTGRMSSKLRKDYQAVVERVRVSSAVLNYLLKIVKIEIC